MNAQSGKNGEPARIRRGRQADRDLNVGIVGAGKACYDLLRALDPRRLKRLRMNILGVMDKNPEAPGFKYARKTGLFTTTSFEEFLALKGLDLILELTGSDTVEDEISSSKPSGVSLIDHRAARLLWDLVGMEQEQRDYQDKEKKQIQIILDSLPYRIMVVNMDMTIDAVNQTFLKEFDLSYDEVQGMYCYEARYGLYDPCGETGDVCFLKDRMGEIKEKGLISTFKEHVDEEGKTRFDVVTVGPIFDEQGEIKQLVEVSRDVTERVALEREVEKSNTFFEKVIQSTVDGIVVVDTKGNVLIFNEGMERLTGYSADEIINRGHLSSFYDIDVAKENMRKMRSDRHGPPGKLNPTSMTVTTNNGEEIPVTLTASIITIENKEIGSVGIFTDMREVLKMRKDLEEAHLQLVQSEKIASVGRMAAGVAHEINNPLSGILIYAELLKEGLKDSPQYLKDVQEVIDQTLRCKKIVSELLEFSRQSVGKVTSFRAEEMIDKSLNILIHQAIFQDIEVVREMSPNMPQMVGDLGQLQQVFTNLFINAADAMGGKGKLTIRGRFDSPRNLFVFEVTDTGPGIPEALRDQIFDIFFTTKAVGKGTGLGLSISQNIIKLHGGSITVNCPPRGGTTFGIELPLGFVEQPAEESLFAGLDE